MKLLVFLSLLTNVYVEVISQLPKDLAFQSDICHSSYSCADCRTARVCRTNAEGAFESLGDVSCSRQRPYCDRSSGSCVSKRPPNCEERISNSNHNLIDGVCNKIFSCLDCNTAQICRPTNDGLVHLKDMPCTADRPYCNPKSGSCSTEQGLGCGTKDSFVCVRDGKFPAADCDSFRVCTNSTSVAYNCAKNQHYDPRTGGCSESVPCLSFICLNNFGRKIPHPLDPRFFAFCGEEAPIVIDSCPAPYELNVTSQVCEAMCHNNGLVQDLDDCRFYYKCTQVFLTESMSYFKKERKQCPDGQAYDPDQFLCVSDTSTIPGCKISY